MNSPSALKSAMKWHPGKRGRPPKDEKVLEDIEKEYEAEMQYLSSRMTLTEAEKTVEQAK